MVLIHTAVSLAKWVEELQRSDFGPKFLLISWILILNTLLNYIYKFYVPPHTVAKWAGCSNDPKSHVVWVFYRLL